MALGWLTKGARRARGMKSALTRRMTAGTEKTASRAAPAYTQQRSSVGTPRKTQASTGLCRAREAFRASSGQVFQAIERQTCWAGFRASTSARNAAGVGGFDAGLVAAPAEALPASSTSTPPTNVIRFMAVSLLVREPGQSVLRAKGAVRRSGGVGP